MGKIPESQRLGKNVESILTHCSMEEYLNLESKCDMDVLKARMQRMQTNTWWLEASSMPKLCTFMQIHDPCNDKI